jgi:hypothetical protein
MSFSPDGRVVQKDTRVPVDKLTVLVDAGSGAIRPDSEAILQIALRLLAGQFLFLCPDQMRVGVSADCRFTAKEGLNDFFRERLAALGVDGAQAAAVTLLVQAELTPLDKKAFDIRTAEAGQSPAGEQVWHVLPRDSGDHRLELRVTPSARIVSAGEVKGDPVDLVRSISVIGVENNFFSDYGPAVVGCLAALGLLGWIGWTLWRGARGSVLSSR